jgi:hypothetical protein
MNVDPQTLLVTSAEIAVAFVGFASLVGVFLARSSGELPARVRIILRALLDYGLLALLGCGIPLLLGLTDLREPAIWMTSSGLFVVAWTTYVLISHYYYREIAKMTFASTGRFELLLLLGDAISVLLLIGNAFGWPFSSTSLIYCSAAVLWRLAGAAFAFRGLLSAAWSGAED